MYLFFLWRREVLKSESFNVFDSCVKYKLLNTIPFASLTELPMEKKNLHKMLDIFSASKKHPTFLKVRKEMAETSTFCHRKKAASCFMLLLCGDINIRCRPLNLLQSFASGSAGKIWISGELNLLLKTSCHDHGGGQGSSWGVNQESRRNPECRNNGCGGLRNFWHGLLLLSQEKRKPPDTG